MLTDDFIKELEKSLSGAVTHFKEELGAIRGNRPSVELVENVKVSYYDQQIPLKQLASIAVKPPREIEINIWDRSALATAMKALEAANIGLTFINEGNILKAFLPALTEERRREFMKLAKKAAENIRIQIRNQRDETIKRIRSAEEKKETSEDEVFKAKEKIQKIVDEVNGKIDALLENKLRELSE